MALTVNLPLLIVRQTLSGDLTSAIVASGLLLVNGFTAYTPPSQCTWRLPSGQVARRSKKLGVPFSAAQYDTLALSFPVMPRSFWLCETAELTVNCNRFPIS